MILNIINGFNNHVHVGGFCWDKIFQLTYIYRSDSLQYIGVIYTKHDTRTLLRVGLSRVCMFEE